MAHLFDHMAILSFKGENEEQVLEAMLDAGIDVDEIESKNGHLTIFAPAGEFFKAKSAVLAAFPGTEFEVQETTFLPQATTEIGPDEIPMFEKFIQMLNDCDDVQEVYHNAIFPT